MGHRKHLNAVDVFSDDLLNQVSDLLDGRAASLWIPSRERINRELRNGYIGKLASEGIPAPEIAERLCVSERHVWRILKKQRAASHPSRSDTAPNQ